MTDQSEPLMYNKNFNTYLGLFYSMWAVTEASLDCALGKFLRLTHQETHILTAGMEYGRKATLLRNLVHHSDYDKKSALLQALNVIQNESLRNIFSHSYIAGDDRTVFFISRSRGGSFSATEHEFTLKSFAEHVEKFADAARKFYDALDVDDLEFSKFQHAALSLNSKSITSPEPPPSSTL